MVLVRDKFNKRIRFLTTSMNTALEAKLGYFNRLIPRILHEPQHFSSEKLLGAYIGLRKHVVIYCHFNTLSDIL